MSFDKHTYQPDPNENSVADQIERGEIVTKSAILAHVSNWLAGLSFAIWLFAALCER